MNQIEYDLQYKPEEFDKRLGCIVGHERDPRNSEYALGARRSATLPKKESEYCWDRIFLDQGRTDSCVGHGWAHWRLDGPTRPPKNENVNPFELYDLARDNDEFPGNDYAGSSTLGGVKAARAKGWVKEFYWANNLNDLVWWLLNGNGPAVTGTYWHYDMAIPDKKGRISLTGGKAGGHEWEYNGINMKERLLRAKNSWGTSWGLKGRFWVTFEQAEELLHDGGDICFASEKKLAFAA